MVATAVAVTAATSAMAAKAPATETAMVTATAAGGGWWAATVAEGGGKASKNVVQAKMEPNFEGSFAVCLAFFEVPAEGGTTFWQFQMTIPKIH